MEAALIISNLLLWVVVILLFLAVFSLARQIGVLHERAAPVTATGLKVGERLDPATVSTLVGRQLRIGGKKDHRTLIYFLSPACPVCTSLLPEVLHIADEGLEVVIASDGKDTAAEQRFVEDHGLNNYPYVVSEQLGARLGVNRLPFAVLLNEAGVLEARGAVNSRDHLDDLLQAE